VHEANRVVVGPYAGQTLAALSREFGADLLGRRAVAQTDTAFPLLIKLLDVADWLSVQVHPNDQQAMELEGPDAVGKTEAWHILDAAPDAQLIAGLQPQTTHDDLHWAIQAGTVTDLARYLTVQAGDTVYLQAGTMHALGPGLLLYEVQQSSDLTYSVFDWHRPQSTGRALHISQSLAVTNPAIVGTVQPPPPADQPVGTLVTCAFFTLERLLLAAEPLAAATNGDTFHALTVVAGAVRLTGDGWNLHLDCYETAVVPATAGAYQVQAHGQSEVLRASVP
jgi:mannose-6-phosphate isomerase